MRSPSAHLAASRHFKGACRPELVEANIKALTIACVGEDAVLQISRPCPHTPSGLQANSKFCLRDPNVWDKLYLIFVLVGVATD